jgi:hypothetical protein
MQKAYLKSISAENALCAEARGNRGKNGFRPENTRVPSASLRLPREKTGYIAFSSGIAAPGQARIFALFFIQLFNNNLWRST